MRFMGRTARMARHHKRHKGEAVINLVSMIDMLTILLFFLLVYSTEEVDIAGGVTLPESIADEETRTSVTVIVSEQDIVINDKSVGAIADIMANDAVIIPALQAELVAAAQREPLVAGLSAEDAIAGREVTIMADREIPYQLLKKVMATSTAAQYGQLSLAVLQKASDALTLAAKD